MTTSTDNLGITEVATNQSQKEVTINNALNALDNAQNRTLPIAFTSNSRTLTATEFTRNFRFLNNATFTAAATLSVPLSHREFVITNTDSNWPIHVGGTSGVTVTVNPGNTILIFNDGTNCTPITPDFSGFGVDAVLGNTGSVSLAELVSGGVAPLSNPDFTGTVTLGAVVAGAGTIDLSAASEVKVPTPVNASDAIPKAYADALIQGLQMKPTAAWATAAALPANTYSNGSSGAGATLTGSSNGALTVDGGTTALNDIMLVKNESTSSHNGLYSQTQIGDGSHPYILTRIPAMDQSTDFVGGFVIVEAGGAANANSMWVCTNTSSPTVGTTAITFTELASSTAVTAGNLISISGNTINAVPTLNAGFVIANTTTATAAGSGVAASGLFDVIGSVQGDIMQRGSSAWAVLTPGTVGQVLKSGGSGANNSWANEIWNAGTVATIGHGLDLTSGTLSSHLPVTLTATASATTTIAPTVNNQDVIVNGPSAGGTITLYAAPAFAWQGCLVHFHHGATASSVVLTSGSVTGGFVFGTDLTAFTAGTIANSWDDIALKAPDTSHFRVEAINHGFAT